MIGNPWLIRAKARWLPTNDFFNRNSFDRLTLMGSFFTHEQELQHRHLAGGAGLERGSRLRLLAGHHAGSQPFGAGAGGNHKTVKSALAILVRGWQKKCGGLMIQAAAWAICTRYLATSYRRRRSRARRPRPPSRAALSSGMARTCMKLGIA